MNPKTFELWIGIKANGVIVEIWNKQTQPGAKTWHLTDFEVRINGKTEKEFPRRSTTAEVFKFFERMAGIKGCGYPILAHCKTGGSPHYRSLKDGTLYWSPFEGLDKPSIYRTVHGVNYSDIKDQPCVC